MVYRVVGLREEEKEKMNLKLYCSEYKYRRYFLIAAEGVERAKMFIEDQESDEYGCEHLEPFIFEKKVMEVQGFPIEDVEYEVEQFNEHWKEENKNEHTRSL